MGADVSIETSYTKEATPTGGIPSENLIVLLTVPHAMCESIQTQIDYNSMNPRALMIAAAMLDGQYRETDVRICDRRALQAAMLLRANILDINPRVRVVILAALDQRRGAPDANRMQGTTLEARVRAVVATLGKGCINVDVHSFPTKGMPGDALAFNDPRHAYFRTATGRMLEGSSLAQVAGERMAGADSLFVNLLPRLGVPSVLVDFSEDKGAFPIDKLRHVTRLVATWVLGEFNVAK